MSETNITQEIHGGIGYTAVGVLHGNLITQQPGEPPPPIPIPPPEILFGRDELCTQVNAALDGGQQPLLCGVGGIGKTALAATLSQKWLEQENSAGVLWLTIGKTGLQGMLSGIGTAFGAGQHMAAAETKDDKLNVARSLIGQGRLLVVLDDCWDGTALATLLKQGIPPNTPTLITSRTKFSLKTTIDVTRLPRSDALDLLGHHAGRDLDAGDSDGLCELLGDHPYAVEIAGAWLADESLTIPELRRKMPDPTTLTMPEGFAEEGRENVAALLAASVDALDPAAQAAFWAIGTLFAPRVTPELLALVMEDSVVGATRETPETADDTPDFRAAFEALEGVDKTDTDAIISAVESTGTPPGALLMAEMAEMKTIDQAHDALRTLARRSLARYMPAEQYCAAYYEIHDLTFAYAASGEIRRGDSRDAQDAKTRAVDACVAYARRHAHEPNTPEGMAHHNALEAELPNLLDAANHAAARGQHQAVNQLGWDLGSGNSDFLDVRGRAAERLALMPLAAEAARALGLRSDEGSHLMHLGLAYADLGRYQDAIAQYEQSLEVARESGNRTSEGNSLGNLGNAYADLGQYQQAIEHHEGALQISREIGDRRGEGANLGNLGIAYFSLGQYERAIEHHQGALEISREIGNRRGEGNDLGNLGLAYYSLGQYERAIEHHEGALEISREIGNKSAVGAILGNLGLAYRNLGRYEQAIEHHQQALQISREIGDRRGQANRLFNIGLLREEQGDLSAAWESFLAARALFEAMKLPHEVEDCDRVIARVRAALSGSDPS